MWLITSRLTTCGQPTLRVVHSLATLIAWRATSRHVGSCLVSSRARTGRSRVYVLQWTVGLLAWRRRLIQHTLVRLASMSICPPSTDSRQSADSRLNLTKKYFTPCTRASGFHYPSWRVSINAPEFSGRQLGPWTRVVDRPTLTARYGLGSALWRNDVKGNVRIVYIYVPQNFTYDITLLHYDYTFFNIFKIFIYDMVGLLY